MCLIQIAARLCDDGRFGRGEVLCLADVCLQVVEFDWARTERTTNRLEAAKADRLTGTATMQLPIEIRMLGLRGRLIEQGGQEADAVEILCGEWLARQGGEGRKKITKIGILPDFGVKMTKFLKKYFFIFLHLWVWGT